MATYDYIIVGSGIAGLYTALLARRLGKVLVLTKGSIDECNTKYAQGGIASAIGRDDSAELHFQDTIAAGAGLCDPEAVRILATEGPDRIADLINLGVAFDTLDGEVALTKEAAHSLPRIVHAGGDATGEHIERTLSQKVRASDIQLLEHRVVTEIVVQEGRVQGVKSLDCRSGAPEEFEGRFLILATGGAGQLFKITTNPDIATGDGISLAFCAGAQIMDMEFFQFHPTGLRLPGVPTFLISEAMRGEGGILRNAHGERFMDHYSPNGDLASRDVVARSILAEMNRTQSDWVFLDITHLPPATVTARFPHIYRFCVDHGLDITRSPIPVSPAAHYMMGGVRTNVWGETNIHGLFAAGETACTGVHGANRLASNSLLEVVVFARRIIHRTEELIRGEVSKVAAPGDEGRPLPAREISTPPPPPSLSALQSLLWDRVGMVRSRESLEEATVTLAAWEKALGQPNDRPSYELRNLILSGRLMAEAALLREESRGAHFRSDFPEPSAYWQRHLIFRNKN
jgi:L-aspartate oxidase